MIFQKKKKNNNNNNNNKIKIKIIDNELAICSSTELLYSFRDTVDSDIPSYTSKTAIRALEKVKEIKEKVSSGIIIFFY